MVSTLTLAVVLGLSVADTSENAVANLGWGDIKLPKPVFAGDTLWAESEVTERARVALAALVRDRLDPDPGA